jgi:hypothetical protein
MSTVRSPIAIRVRAGALALAFTLGLASVTRAQAGSPVDDLLKSATKALDLFKYREADSLAKSAMAFGSVLTRQQQVLALEISIASAYPEDKPNERQTDSAMARIKRLITFDSKAWDRNLSWDQLDSLYALVVRSTRPGKVVIGSRTPGAVLTTNGVPQGLVGSLRTIEVSPDVEVKIKISADKCAPWDTVLTVHAADSVIVGRKNLTCMGLR